MTANASIEYQLDTVFSGTAPAGSGPWIDAYFIDGAPGSGIVYLTVTNVSLTTGEFVQGNGNGASGGLFFNLNPSDDPTALNFTLISSNGDFGPIIKTGENEFKADGDGYYDIQFDFSQQTFSVDSSFTYKLTLTGGDLTAADFEYESDPAGGAGPFYAAAKVMGLTGSGSGFIEPSGGYTVIPVPEPTSLALLATGIGLLFARTRRVRRT